MPAADELAEAPGSRTQPPRAGGERPILKTGRATGPRSLPETSSVADALPKRVSPDDGYAGGFLVGASDRLAPPRGLEEKTERCETGLPASKKGNLPFD